MILASDLSAATLLALLTAAMYVWAALRRKLVSQRAARLGMFAAWLCHAAVLALGFGLGGDPAHFGFGPAMSMTAWLVLGIYGVETWLYPQLPTRWGLGAAGADALGLAVGDLLDDELEELVRVRSVHGVDRQTVHDRLKDCLRLREHLTERRGQHAVRVLVLEEIGEQHRQLFRILLRVQ